LLAAEADQGLEGGHRGAAAVEPEDVFVEVGLQMLAADSSVGALQPALEVADHPVDPGQDLARVLAEGSGCPLTARLVVARRPHSCRAPQGPRSPGQLWEPWGGPE
jgi:hypothetical protein